MKWYHKYAPLLGQPYGSIGESHLEEIASAVSRHSHPADPLVSVVVIAYNEEKHLPACLWSLADNKCAFNIEIIGINNNSNDRTGEIFRRLGVTCYDEPQPGAGHARQCGLDHCQGKYYFCIDADTIYPPHYITTMVRQLQKPGVVGVSSLYNYIPDAEHPRLGLFAYQTMRDFHVWATSLQRPEMSVRGAVFAFDATSGKKERFRTDIRRGEDGSMALSLKKYGKIQITLHPKARAVTSARILDADGNLWQSFKVRFLKYLRQAGSYFTAKKEYKDENSNLL